MRKQTHFKKVVSLAVAAAMAVSVCTVALAEDAPNEANGQTTVSEQQVESGTKINNADALVAAIDAAEDGATIKLDGDVALAKGLVINKNLTFDLGNCKLTYTGGYLMDIYSNVTIKNGQMIMRNGKNTSAIWVNGTANLTVESNAQIYALESDPVDSSFDIAFDPSCTSARVTVRGTLGGENGVTVNGSIKDESTSNELIIENADIGVSGNGIYQAGLAKTSITNSTVAGHTGIEVRAGAMEITDSKVVGQAPFACNPNGSGGTTDGAAIAIAQHTTKLPINVVINSGTFSKGTTSGTSYCVYESNPQGNSAEDIAKTALSIKGGSFDGTVYSQNLNGFITGGTFDYKLEEKDVAGGYIANYIGGQYVVQKVDTRTATISVAGTAYTFTAADIGTELPHPEMEGYTYKGLDFDGITGRYTTLTEDLFNQLVAAGQTVSAVAAFDAISTPAPATPAPTAAPTATPAPTAAPVEVKPAAPVVNDSALKDVTTEEKEKLVEAAKSATISESKELANNETVQNVAKSADDYIAADGTVKDTLKEDILKAADAPEELKRAADANISNITLVSAPYLAVTPQKSEDGTLIFDIKLYCALKATTDPDNMTATNTCTLKTEKVKDAPVMNITLDVSKAYSGNELNTLYVRHVTESGAVYYYKAYSKGNGIIEFTNPHGFSTFTVLSDTRIAKVKLAGKEYGYDIAGIGVEFPHPDMPGYTYKGYQFDGISGSYTTLTEELFNKLAAAGKTVSATATFSAIATPAPAAAPEATAAPTATPAPTPDDSQYYTCKDCGHHNWTATADGYKCDTCGRIETKQLSGYKNVKGTYTPTASAAAAKTTSAIPQTSDTMPIVPIAIVMIAALLGLGVTLYMKKKKN